ncbi:MAG: hypothetical protein M8364_18470 [Methylobacter sp.]|uniref:hypothetical protein n=1 Tax=Methylobacter sp. TaxID=2051955 RepID=UPI0025896C4B|nr:hypothetical protein [Methylobacter sp.]MCL7422879.1 hypothetical protein [Methylobacter sp.]
MKYSERYSIETLSVGLDQDPQGRLFVNSHGVTDLTDVDIIGASVDTVRQLFYGVPLPEMVEKLERHAENHDEIITLTGRSQSMKWHFTRMGKVAKYRYKLQNNEEGLVVLFGSYYGKLDTEGQHLKIELSPHFISQYSVRKIWQRLHGEHFGLSRLFLSNPVPKGVAVHLACDYQGFNLPDDFVQKFSTYSRTFRAFDGLAEIDLSDISEAIASYGGKHQAKNYLIGKVASVQMCLYDKGHEIIKSDKVDYFTREWAAYSIGTYDPDKPVRRIEARLHHQVIREIGLGLGVELESFEQVEQYLTDIWRYALTRNRLMMDEKTVHPLWQLLMQDVFFYVPAKDFNICRKKKVAVDPIARNIASVIGNLVSIYARQGLKTGTVMAQLKLLRCYPEIVRCYRSRGLNEDDLRQTVERGLNMRRLVGTAA